MVDTGRVDSAEFLQSAARIAVEGDDVLGAPICHRALGAHINRSTLGADGDGIRCTQSHRAAGLIVDTHHGPLRAHGRGGFKQPGLGVEVRLHRRVKVQMVAGQIRETACCKTDSVDPAEFESMTGDFHHRGVDAAFSHHREQGLQCRRLRCGQCAGHILPGDPDSDGADQAHRASRRTQPGLDQVRGGGFAGCSRHAEHSDPI